MPYATDAVTIPSPVGDLYLVAAGDSICGLFMDSSLGRPGMPVSAKPAGVLAAAVRQLGEYFAGSRTAFDLPLDLAGTPFQMRVWAELGRIPYGEAISYAALAARVGNPNGSRAVGSANGRNPVSILVPCHRVIAADGTLGGYGGGLERKEFLLRLEGVAVTRTSVSRRAVSRLRAEAVGA